MTLKSGFVGVLGKTNVGKSTLINALMGKKTVIVSDKPQTTRNRIRCILNLESTQIVFVDTPGLHKPVDKLSNYLIHQALSALEGLDLVLYLIEPWGEVKAYEKRIFEQLAKMDVPCFLIINKVDQAQGNEVLETIRNHAELGVFTEIIPISSLNGHNLETVLPLIQEKLPEGPAYFERDQETDRPLPFLISELIREQVFQLTREEIPYSIAVEVSDMVEREDKPLIELYAYIDVARNSQRGILIGKRGEMIKKIGQQARQQIESLLGVQVFLELKVRVVKKWNEDPKQIKRLLGQDA